MEAFMKHTPGPWKVMRSPYGHHFVRTSQSYTLESLDILSLRIANCATNDVDEDTEAANAALIASAPEMLEALVKAEALLEKHSVDENAFRAKLHFLIKKARGES